MEEVRLWKMTQSEAGLPGVTPVEGVNATATEQLLEDILAHSPDVLMNGLTLIGRQNSTAGGPLDLLGVDEDGRLIVFELKRGTLTRDAVSQVVDYASYLFALEPDELNRQVTEVSGRGGTEKLEDFGAWYQENFQSSLAEIGRPRMVLVGLGVDERAKRMVEYLADANVDISLITFYGFQEHGETFLARQVEVEARGSEETTRSTKRNNQQQLDERLRKFGIESYFNNLVSILRHRMGESVYQWPNITGCTLSLPETTDTGSISNRAYANLYVPDDFDRSHELHIVIRKSVLEALGKDKLSRIVEALGSELFIKPAGNSQFSLDGKQPLDDHQPWLDRLGSALHEAWQIRRRKTDSDAGSIESDAVT